MIRQLHLLLCCSPALGLHATNSTDSLSALAGRLAERMDRLGHTTAAVMGIPEDGEQALTDVVTAEFTFHLANKANGFDLVERARLDVLLNEQRLSASGLLDEAHAVELGGLASASAIVAVHVRPLGRRQVLVEVKLLHATTGALEGMERTMIDRPAGIERPQDTSRRERLSAPVRAD
ncbi:MAG TPA: CsgG/HfaB family protein, partial [Flavobacteriales bacterium]|nr:CsgG/HfaB family protein [Flavobacteriales bacterium]